jgi:hypothetical protein
MRCYFMRGGHIHKVEMLASTDDQGRIAEARRLFEASHKERAWEGFEVWEGERFVYAFPDTGDRVPDSTVANKPGTNAVTGG